MRRESEFRLFTFSFSGGPASDDLRGPRRTRKAIVLHPCKPGPRRFRRNFPPGSHRGARGCECPHGNRCRGFPSCSHRVDCCGDFHPGDEPSTSDGLPDRRSGHTWHRSVHGWPGIAHGSLHPSPRLPFSIPGRYPPGNGLQEHRFLQRGSWFDPLPEHRLL